MKNISLIFLLTLSLYGCAQNNHTLTGHINQYPSSMIYLYDYYGSENTKIDSVAVDSEGRFRFQLGENMKPGFYRLVGKKTPLLDLIYHQEDIAFSTDYHSPMKEMKIEKSKENQLYYEYLETLAQRQQQSQLLGQLVAYYPDEENSTSNLGQSRIQAEIQYVRDQQKAFEKNIRETYPNSFFASILAAQQNPEIPQNIAQDESASREWLKHHFWDQVDFSDERLLQSTVLVSKVSAFLEMHRDKNQDFAEQGHTYLQAIEVVLNKSAENQTVHDFILNELTKGFGKTDYDQVSSYLSERYAEIHGCENPEKSAEMRSKANRLNQLAIGQPAPSIQIPNQLGKEIDLSKIEADHTLVIFWASWCGHCQELLPEIRKIYEYQNQKNPQTTALEVVAISLDQDEADWKKFISWGNYKWINLSERKGWDSEIVETYNVWATPKMFLLDKDKKIVARPMNSQQITDYLQPKLSVNH